MALRFFGTVSLSLLNFFPAGFRGSYFVSWGEKQLHQIISNYGMFKFSVKLTVGGSSPSKSSYIAWKDTKKSKWRISLSIFLPIISTKMNNKFQRNRAFLAIFFFILDHKFGYRSFLICRNFWSPTHIPAIFSKFQSSFVSVIPNRKRINWLS